MHKKILIVDNYDSFTFNLVHIVEEIVGDEFEIVKNDAIPHPEDMDAFSHIILSPGPGIPDEAGHLKEVIRYYAYNKKILGVCLGLQAIGDVSGGRLINLNDVFHGIKTKMRQTDTNSPIFQDVPQEFFAGRYHSWVIDPIDFPAELSITARDENGQIMAIQHHSLSIFGVQFHPESIMTDYGKKMIENFIYL